MSYYSMRALELVQAYADNQDDTEYDVEYQTLVNNMLRFGTPRNLRQGVEVNYKGHRVQVEPTDRNKYLVVVDRSTSLVARDQICGVLHRIKQELDQKDSKQSHGKASR